MLPQLQNLKKFIVVFLFFGLFANVSQAQEQVVQDWKVLKEIGNEIDVAYRIASCDLGKASLQLSVFNESLEDQDLKLKLKISDKDSGQSFEKEIILSAKKMMIYKGDCLAGAAGDALRVEIPMGYNPSQLKVSIQE